MGLYAGEEIGVVVVKGVSENKEKKLWEANYYSETTGRLREAFKSEEEAINQRKNWEKSYGATKYGVKKGSIFNDVRGKTIKNFFILDYLPNDNKKVLDRNLITGKLQEMDLHGILHGQSTGVPLVLKNIKFYSKEKEYGIGFRKDTKKWRAVITVNNKQITLGSFNTKEEAIAARKAAEDKYFKPIIEKYNNHKGDF